VIHDGVSVANAEATTRTTGHFDFSSPDGGETCSAELDSPDDSAYNRCPGTAVYSELAPGQHRFEVRSRDDAGNVGEPAAC